MHLSTRLKRPPELRLACASPSQKTCLRVTLGRQPHAPSSSPGQRAEQEGLSKPKNQQGVGACLRQRLMATSQVSSVTRDFRPPLGAYQSQTTRLASALKWHQTSRKKCTHKLVGASRPGCCTLRMLSIRSLGSLGTRSKTSLPIYAGHFPLRILLRACLPCLVGATQVLAKPTDLPEGWPYLPHLVQK